jgi:hypothetical protein
MTSSWVAAPVGRPVQIGETPKKSYPRTFPMKVARSPGRPMALLAAAALMPASVAVVYDQSIDVTWIGGAVNDLWASCDGWDSGYCPMKCAQVTIEDDAPVTVATRVSRVNNEQHCFVLEDSRSLKKNHGG